MDYALDQWMNGAREYANGNPASTADCLMHAIENCSTAPWLDRILSPEGDAVCVRLRREFPHIVETGGVVRGGQVLIPFWSLSTVLPRLRRYLIERQDRCFEADSTVIEGCAVTHDLATVVEGFYGARSSPRAPFEYLLFLQCLLTTEGTTAFRACSAVGAPGWLNRAEGMFSLPARNEVLSSLGRHNWSDDDLKEMAQDVWSGENASSEMEAFLRWCDRVTSRRKKNES